MSFGQLELNKNIVKALKGLGFKEPTPIQSQAIPALLQGKDLVASAQTGTGKTAAFALPVIHRLERHEKRPRALIVEPTRELAVQVLDAIRDYSKYTNLKCSVVYGGVGYGRQITEFKEGIDIIVATPGRLLDHASQRNIDLRSVEYLILDEADRMLDMGFLPDVKRIVELCPKDRQSALFSATMPPKIEALGRFALRDPIRVEIGVSRTPAETVDHCVFPVAESQKTDLLKAIFKTRDLRSVICFCRTKHRVDRVAAALRDLGLGVAVIHSDRTQRDREQALALFREGKRQALVATDIAARGLDIPEVSHVINFDTPRNPEDYIHRIGRTGRAEARGEAYTIAVMEDAKHLEDIERFIGKKVRREKLEGFDYLYTAFADVSRSTEVSSRKGAAKGGRITGGYSFAPAKPRRRRR